MSGTFNACSCFVFIAVLTAATKLQPTASASAIFQPDGGSGTKDGDRQKTSSSFDEVVPSSIFEDDPSAIAAAAAAAAADGDDDDEEEEDDDFQLSPLAGDVERRRSNFRGDLGKRNQRSGSARYDAEMAAVRRGMRMANSRLRPDLGKRSSMSEGGAAVGGRLLVESRTTGLRRRFRPDLGKRAPDSMDDETLLHLPSYRGFGSDGLLSPEADLWNDYAYRQSADGSDTAESDAAKRGRQSTFRGDLGKRRSQSSFRGDLGRRRRRSRNSDERNDWQLSPASSRTLDDAGDEGIDEEDIERLAKRVRANAKSAFRGDLGKRRSSFRGDLGKRDSSTTDDSDDGALGSNKGGVDGPLSGAEKEKRPRMSFLRGDLGKRDTPVYGAVGEAPDAASDGIGTRSASSLVKRPRPQSFRGDLGKRSVIDATESRASGSESDAGSSSATAAHQ